MFFYHRTSNVAAKVSGLSSGAPEVIAAEILNLFYKDYAKNEIQYLFALPRRQFRDYTEIYAFVSQDV